MRRSLSHHKGVHRSMIFDCWLGRKYFIVIVFYCILLVNGLDLRLPIVENSTEKENTPMRDKTALAKNVRVFQTNSSMSINDSVEKDNVTGIQSRNKEIIKPKHHLTDRESEKVQARDKAMHENGQVETTPELPSEPPEYRIVNPYIFTPILQPSTLPSTQLDALIWVHTRPDHFRRRIALRETWTNSLNFPGVQMQVLFFMGFTNDQTTQQKLSYEAEFYQDIVQDNYFDSYKNLTYKAMSGLKYITENFHKSDIKLIFKVDDDMLIDLERLFDNFIKQTSFLISPVNNMILCNVYDKSRVKRDKNSKWRITRREFRGKWFPQYCAGAAVFISHDLIPRMWYKAERTPFMWIDDVYFSGILTKDLNHRWIHINGLYEFGKKSIRYQTTSWRWRPILHMSPYNYDQLYLIYKNRDRIIRVSDPNLLSVYVPKSPKLKSHRLTKKRCKQFWPSKEEAKQIAEDLKHQKPFTLL